MPVCSVPRRKSCVETSAQLQHVYAKCCVRALGWNLDTSVDAKFQMLPPQVLLRSVPPNGPPQRITVLPRNSARGCPGVGGCGLYPVASNFHTRLPQHPCLGDSVLRAYGIPSSTPGWHGHSLVDGRYCNLLWLLFSQNFFCITSR